MSIELTPLGTRCNISCPHCYQHPMRDAGNNGADVPYDMDKMLRALDAEGGKFSVFGGEPLLVPLKDLRTIWAYGFKKWKENAIQTNGVLITPEHIQTFREYRVHVGFSLDGPGEMNDSRWSGTVERTRETTEKSFANLRACIAAGVGTSVIITLYKGNATSEHLPKLHEWIRSLDRDGVRGIRIHVLEVDHPDIAAKMQLTPEENIAALRSLIAVDNTLAKSFNIAECPTLEEARAVRAANAGKHPRVEIFERRKNKVTECFVVWSRGIDLDILKDMKQLLRADDDAVTCVWNACDAMTTQAVRGVDGQGNRSNCGRTNKDGIPRLKAEKEGHERQVILYHTPYEHGGCKGCRFFLPCKGQCPGTAIDGDWRQRTADCTTWMGLFEDLERTMMLAGEMPITLSPDRVRLEQAMVEMWAAGGNSSIKQALVQLKARKPLAGQDSAGHGDAAHGDAHGDSHGDSDLAPVQ